MDDGPIRVLLIEDNPGDVRLITEILSEARDAPFELECVDQLSAGLECLSAGDIDIVLLDLSLPDSYGFDTFAKMHTHASDVPIILLTGIEDEALGIQAVREGAQDYLVKGYVDSPVLMRAIRYAIERKRVEEALRKARDELEMRVAERTTELSKVNEELQMEIVERKQVGESLLQSISLLQATLESTADGILVVDRAGKIVSFNRRFAEMWRIPDDVLASGDDDQALAFVLDQLRDPDDFIAKVRDLYGRPEAESFDVLYFKDGHIFERYSRPQRIGDEVAGRVWSFRDVTERKEAEERVRRQDRLAAVGQLASGIAHDFNNLLTGIIGYAQMLRRRAGMPESAKVDLQRIEGEGQRAAHLIRQILDFSRKSAIQPQYLDLVPFLKEATKFLQRTIPESIRIILDMRPVEYPINADPTQMQQVVTNLAVNARDAMPEGGELRFRLSRFVLKAGQDPPLPEMLPGEWIELSVSDTGAGIPPDVRPHIFEPFFTTKGVGKGTGLGLSQVYGIMMQHDGLIDVRSEVGEGTTFVLYLPVLDMRKEMPGEEAAEELVSGRGEMVLVVEDQPVVLDMLGKMLEDLGYRVLMTGSGMAALEVYERHRDEIAVVLTDMVMPGMSGVGLFRALRDQDPDVKVVVMTGYSLGQDEKELLSLGVARWVQKPITLGVLSRVMDEILHAQR